MEKTLYAETFKAEDVHGWFLALHELIESYVEDYCRQKGGARSIDIFDAGCGTGKLMERLKKYGQVDGMDFSEDAVAFCKKRGLENAVVGDLNRWSPSKTYDVITNIDVLYHKAIVDDTAVLKQFHCSLKEEGLLIFAVAAFECLKRSHDAAGHAARRYRRKEMVGKLKESGFRVEVQSYRGSYFFPPAFLKARLWCHSDKNTLASDLSSLPSPGINRWMHGLMRFENKLLRKFNLPFGVSLFIVARKPKT